MLSDSTCCRTVVPLVFSQIVWLNIPMLLVKRFVVLSVLTFASLSGLSQDRSVLDLATLSGHWEGTMSVAQTGACRLTGPQQFPHAVVLMVNADGSLECAPRTGEFPSQIEYRPIGEFHV